ncbi:MAG TPA: phospholipase D family protein [Gemmataceae bacterium]|jgi:phosphatidylserine/phosphatidylglycerophosphate/cardiolipin synthase-like enzyme|nr:phospholipase D family protein [Gemmataceae bacterium]
MWLYLATGFTGGLTLVFLIRWVVRLLEAHLTVDAYYSPKGGCTEAVVREIHKARKEVLVQAYSFTSKPIAGALIEAKGRGAHVEILLDKSNEKETFTELEHLIKEGLIPQIDAHHAIAHNKIMIIDKRTLITGSFNFTHQAEVENAENLLIIKGKPELVNTYRQQFLAHKSHCQAPGTKVETFQHRKAA